ncbi:uncharacterized protein LOC142980108 [Anticarsia gemmatalis]|uniref:uncharacterized protein LOC142980108 n=1 Tax=Anticarsia gemmatalis TaxID=129554 RepID=UPI003F75F8A3
MRSWLVLILFGHLLIQVICRPQQAEYNNDSDLDETAEDDESDSAPETYSADDDDTRLSDQDSGAQEDEVPRNRHLLDLTESRYLQRNAPDEHTSRVISDTASDSKASRIRNLREEDPSESAYNEQSRNYQKKRRQLNRYVDASDEQETRFANQEGSKSGRAQGPDESQVSKRTIETETTNDDGEMIFERNSEQVSRMNKNEYNANDASDSEQPRYIKQYYNTMQAENRDIVEDKVHDNTRYNLRDRREIKETNEPRNSKTPNVEASKEGNDKSDNEDEESAIKRHIKKLSSDELDQLLGSLTEEKRLLLKKLIDDTDSSDANGFINKREITKKAGAVEENNYIENCQSDLSKVQGGSSALEGNTENASPQPADTTENNKQSESQTDNSDAPQKTSESNISSVSKSEVSSHNDDASWKKTDNSFNTFSLNIDPNIRAEIADIQVTAKTENKREANMKDLEDTDESLSDNKVYEQDYSNDQSYFCSQDENLSNLMDEENQPREEKTRKREALEQPSEADSIKSLEESFPNSNAYDDSGPYSGPLVRVKRKNYNQIKKRAAGLLPDAKVAYFPYKAENDDEDNEEGNEFDDEGFYDRTSNFNNRNKGVEEDAAADRSENQAPANNMNPDNSKSTNDNADSNTMSLGSDTDSVLSGVEGVDDNLMYNSGLRNRRTAEDNSGGPQAKTESTLNVDDEVKTPAESNINLLHYQENDAFGPLPRSYDGESARYKRIRRVKQSHDAEDQNTADT